MKNLLKYLILSILALALYDGARGVTFCCADTSVCEVQDEIASIHSSISSKKTDICIPRQVSSVNSVRLQGNGRRYEHFQRHSFECVKSGKVLNSGVRYLTQIQSLISNSSHLEPSYTLIRLCRFII